MTLLQMLKRLKFKILFYLKLLKYSKSKMTLFNFNISHCSTFSYAKGHGRSPLAASSDLDRRHSASKVSELKNPFSSCSNAKSLLKVAQINSLSDQSRSSVTPSPSGSSRKSSFAQGAPHPGKTTTSRTSTTSSPRSNPDKTSNIDQSGETVALIHHTSK